MTGNYYQLMAPIRRKSDGNLYELSSAQKKACDELCRKECCNYYNGNCLLLEEESGECPCVQRSSYHVLCRWFQSAVLPLNWKLEGEIFHDANLKTCEICGANFVSVSRNVRYCPDCRKDVRRIKGRRYKQTSRLREKERSMSAF